MKHFITFIFCLVFTIGFAQKKGINLIKNTSNKTTFLKENRRIKVKTTDGKSIAGKFTIVSDSDITIKGRLIAMDSIVSIRKASTFSAIASPISIVVGGTLLVGAMVGLAAGGYGILLTAAFLPPGLPLFIIPFTAKKHPVKQWTYEIVNE